MSTTLFAPTADRALTVDDRVYRVMEGDVQDDPPISFSIAMSKMAVAGEPNLMSPPAKVARNDTQDTIRGSTEAAKSDSQDTIRDSTTNCTQTSAGPSDTEIPTEGAAGQLDDHVTDKIVCDEIDALDAEVFIDPVALFQEVLKFLNEEPNGSSPTTSSLSSPRSNHSSTMILPATSSTPSIRVHHCSRDKARSSRSIEKQTAYSLSWRFGIPDRPNSNILKLPREDNRFLTACFFNLKYSYPNPRILRRTKSQQQEPVTILAVPKRSKTSSGQWRSPLLTGESNCDNNLGVNTKVKSKRMRAPKMFSLNRQMRK